MKIRIIDTEKMDLTDAIRDYLQTKIDMLDKFIDDNDESADVDIILGRKNNHHHKGDDIYFCELNVHVAGKDFHLTADEADLYAAIDLAKDEMSRLLRRHKDKKDSLIKRGGAHFKAFLRGFRK